MAKEIRVRFAGIEKGPGGEFCIHYIPDETQVLKAGWRYKIVLEGLTYEQHGKAKDRKEKDQGE